MQGREYSTAYTVYSPYRAGNTALHLMFIQNTEQGIQHCIYCLFRIQSREYSTAFYCFFHTQSREYSTASTVYSPYRAGNTALHLLFIHHTGQGIVEYSTSFTVCSAYSAQYSIHYAVIGIQGREYRNPLFIRHTMHSTAHIVLYCIQNIEHEIPYNVQNTVHCALYRFYRIQGRECCICSIRGRKYSIL
jgi:hypothetical protein